ncbi:hypothetical protein [Desulfurivibrio dismutans]|uniref:hypothetical protein n=1 Tax=Desulfurivibrio dismutans TaxID=1398908 RepID=UPI0023DCE68E|nr:hypothetical protein [Desulfurivibrio alkaliphilus]MDF1614069.1 hypothetical protein [Desulfurivibrio alkaliphilus]
MEVTDKRLWRVVFHYVSKAMEKLDLQSLKALAMDETKSRRRHKYVTIFIDLDRYLIGAPIQGLLVST